eukprot:CAMPEP_0185019642 /NCGR_PEP_ID=MMETSP1103-20130426/2257_1 /TAXON_ID=36769 /ORGANISM="Paraphysomonas bandaiensis, Strain Caron Lab Isolate" /LENGTH=280 /DNA_ID=CAMNT_0027550069 /DNA_START=294 /DNA_END=1136 /DNA_ORIENTATION=-
MTYGYICYRDFVIALWDYCSLPTLPLVDFVFALYDADGSKDIDMDEAKTLISDMYGGNYKQNPECVRVMSELNLLREVKSIDIETFHHFVKMNPTLIKPAYDLQKQLRARIGGEEFWMIYSKRRVDVFGTKFLLPAKEILSKFDRTDIPPSPAYIKELNKAKAAQAVPVERPRTPPEKGSKEWKKQKLSKFNPHVKGLDSLEGSYSSPNMSPMASGKSHSSVARSESSVDNSPQSTPMQSPSISASHSRKSILKNSGSNSFKQSPKTKKSKKKATIAASF